MLLGNRAAGEDSRRGSRTEHAAAEAERLHDAVRVHVLHERDLRGVAGVTQQAQAAHLPAASKVRPHLARGHLGIAHCQARKRPRLFPQAIVHTMSSIETMGMHPTSQGLTAAALAHGDTFTREALGPVQALAVCKQQRHLSGCLRQANVAL